MAEDTIEIEYQLTEEDFLNFYRGNALEKSKIPFKLILKNSLFFVIRFIITVFAILLVLRLVKANGDFNKAFTDISVIFQSVRLWLIAVFFLVIINIWTIFLYPKRYGKAVSEIAKDGYNTLKESGVSNIRLLLDQKCFELHDGHLNRKAEWKSVEKVELINGFLNISMPRLEIFIPQNYFKSEQDQKETFEKLQKWFQDSREEVSND